MFLGFHNSLGDVSVKIARQTNRLNCKKTYGWKPRNGHMVGVIAAGKDKTAKVCNQFNRDW